MKPSIKTQEIIYFASTGKFLRYYFPHLHSILMDKWLINLTPQVDKSIWDKQHMGECSFSEAAGLGSTGKPEFTE